MVNDLVQASDVKGYITVDKIKLEEARAKARKEAMINEDNEMASDN